MARTAVVAGTATAVSNRVSRRQANRWARDDQSAYYQAAQPPQYAPAPQYAQPTYVQPQYAAAAPAPPSAVGRDVIDELQELGKLHEQGILTDEEFTTQKARLLGS
jgi:hypothetical protein